MIAGGRASREDPALKDSNFVSVTEESQEFVKAHIRSGASMEPGFRTIFACDFFRKLRQGDARRGFGDKRHDFMSVDLAGGHILRMLPGRAPSNRTIILNIVRIPPDLLVSARDQLHPLKQRFLEIIHPIPCADEILTLDL